MEKNDIDGMSINELWNLHLEISGLLVKRLTAKLSGIEQRLRELQRTSRPDRPCKKQRLRRATRVAA